MSCGHQNYDHTVFDGLRSEKYFDNIVKLTANFHKIMIFNTYNIISIAIILYFSIITNGFHNILRTSRFSKTGKHYCQTLLENQSIKSKIDDEHLSVQSCKSDNQQIVIKSEYETKMSWIVSPQQYLVNTTISNYLYNNCEQYFESMTAIKKAIRRKLIHINNKVITNTYVIQVNDTIEHIVRSSVHIENQSNLTASHNSDPTSHNLSQPKLEVVWEDEHLAVIHKPQGMPVYNTQHINSYTNNNTTELSLHTALFNSLSPAASGVEYQPLRRPRLVHRLDQGTGGLLVVAKTQQALVKLTGYFSDHLVNKTYRAILSGRLDPSDVFVYNNNYHNTDNSDSSSNNNSVYSDLPCIDMPIDGKEVCVTTDLTLT